jgi:hypothetical protein
MSKTIDGLISFDENEKKIEFDEDIANFMAELIKEFTDYYKEKYNKDEKFNIISDINIANPESTNHPMELFYNSMYEYNFNEGKNNFNKIYDYIEIKDENEFEQLYVILKNNIPYKLSQSFFSLLIELVNCKREYTENTVFKIMNLK